MSTAVADPATKRRNILTSAQLPTTTIPLLLVAAYAASFGLLALFDAASWLSGLALGSLVFLAAGFALSAAVESSNPLSFAIMETTCAAPPRFRQDARG